MKVSKARARWCTGQQPDRESGRNTRAGISMVEVMVAIVVLLIASSAAFMSQVTSMRMVGQSSDIALAMSDLEACMERVRQEPVDALAVPGSTFEHGESVAQYEDLHLRDERIVVTYPGYVAGAPLPSPLEVVITASWTPARGGQIRQSLRTVRVR
ncbi:MAG: type II secretion system protein [Planctomycetes bacterium]|nr:type II secretion system protein [Planctomycetota bacterium]